MDQSSSKSGLELLQGAGFCDVSWGFIPVPDGPWEEWTEINAIVDSLLEEPSLASGSAIAWS